MKRKSRGDDLLDKVCETLDVMECDYFGLLHAQRGDPRVWVDLNKRLSKTFRSRLTCSGITYALLASYILQAELGDFCERHVSPSLLSKHRAAPLSALTPDLEAKIEELGQTPAEAELNYLENAKRLALYGAELHGAQDCDHVHIVLARSFTLKLRASEFDEFETHLSFNLPSTTACKKLWRCTVEHHMFFSQLILNAYSTEFNRYSTEIQPIFNKRSFTHKLRASEFDEFETHLSFNLPSTTTCKKLWRCTVEHH
ncbi:putative coracle, partial [Operophtera brumata]